MFSLIRKLPGILLQQAGRGFAASRGKCFLVLLNLVAMACGLLAAPFQISGNYAYLPDGQGRLKVVNISAGTNVSAVTTSLAFDQITGIHLHRNFAFVSVHNDGMRALDLTASPPTFLEGSRLRTDGTAEGIVMTSHYAFIANGNNGIVGVDVFDPSEPLELTQMDVLGQVSSLDVSGNHLYAACQAGGLAVFNISDLTGLEELGRRFTVTPAKQVRVAGHYAYVVCSGGRMEIIDVQAPINPGVTFTYITANELAGVDVAGNFAVVARTNGTLITLNVSNPNSPFAVSTNSVTGGATAVRIVANHAYVRTFAGEMVAVTIPALAASVPMLREGVMARTETVGRTVVMSVWATGNTPLSYQWSKGGVNLVDNAHIRGTTNSWLVISNVTQADAGVYAVRITNALGTIVSSNSLTVVTPGTPLWRGAFNPGGSSEGIDIANRRAYIAAGDYGFEVFDVSNPRHPYIFDGYAVDGPAVSVRVENDYGYVAIGTNGLQVFNTSLSETLGTTNTVGNARGIYLDGGMIYVADGANGLQVFHLNDQMAPVHAGGFDTPGFAWNVFVADGVAYVADGTNGISILSVTNPAAISARGVFDTPGEARQVRVVGNKAFVADGANGLTIWNIANPASASLLGSHHAAAPALDLDVVENIVVVACDTNGLKVLDVANPAAPISLGQYPVAPAKALRLAGNYVYVATGPPGIQIFEIAGLTPNRPEITVDPADGVRLPGEGITFQISAIGTAPLSYRWFHNDVPLYDNADVKGANTPTLTVTNLTYADSGEYTVVVRNGWNLTTWAGGILSVVPVGTPVHHSGYSNALDPLAIQVIGETAYVASRLGGLQTVDWSNPMNPVLIGQHPTLDLAQDVCVRGRYAFVASWEAGLEIFDVMNRTNLVRVGYCNTPGLARQVRVSDSRAYIADRIGGLSIIDITDPTHPQLIGRAATDGFAEGVAAHSNHVFIAAARAGLQIFNAADPLSPLRIAELDTPGHAENVVVVGQHAYVADYKSGLRIVNVSNPGQPTLLSEYQTAGDAFQIQVVSNRAYIAEGISKVSVLNVSNPAAPTHITTSLAGESVRSLHVVGKHALYADRANGVMVTELLGMPPVAPHNLTLQRDGAELVGRELVLSAACEGTPPLRYTWKFNGVALTNGLMLTGANQPHLRLASLGSTNSGNYTVVVSNSWGSVTSAVAVVNVKTSGVPQSPTIYDTSGSALAVAVAGNYAYLAAGADGLQIVNLADTNQPSAVAAYAPTGSVMGLCLQANRLYLALGTNGVAVLDISQPQQPKFLGAFDTPGTALSLDVVSGRAYVADGNAGLRILNVLNPSGITELGHLDTMGAARDVRMQNGHAFVAAGLGGLKIIDINNPATPFVLGEYTGQGDASGVRVSGNRAYVAFADEGLVILDVSDPSAPELLGGYPAVNVSGLDLVGSLILLGRGESGYQVLDVSNLEAITVLGGLTAADVIRGILLLGNKAYLAAGTDGLHVVDLAGVPPQLPVFSVQPTNVAALQSSTAYFEAWPSGGTPTISCRWYFNDLPLFDNARISGAASSRLTISNVAFVDAGNYQMRVFGPAGVTNSQAAQLVFVGPLQAQINAALPGSVVQLAAGTYTENLVLDRDLTIAGKWWQKAQLNGGNHGPTLRILPGANVTLRGIAVSGGLGTGAGGGILNEGTLTLDHCLLTGNLSLHGGGIANFGTLNLAKTIVSNNIVTGLGGGIYNGTGARLNITNSTIIANSADEGGGIANLGTNILANSLLAFNHAAGANGRGGGMRVTAGLVQFVNATVSGNTAFSTTVTPSGGRGGGLHASGGQVDLNFSTFANNSALVTGGGLTAASGSEVQARNSVFAANLASDAVDCSGTLFSGGHILVQSAGGLNLGGVMVGNQLDVNARLGPLQDNGGPTRTHAPLAGSPIIDAGAAPGPTVDGRGIKRPFDIPWQSGLASHFDLGAVEHVDLTPYLVVSNRTASSFSLVWPNNAVLQHAVTPVSSWIDRATVSPFQVITATNQQGYYRLRTVFPASLVTMSNHTASGFDLAWPDFGILERAPALSGPWDTVTGISPYRATLAPGENEFFRVRVLPH